MGTYAVKTATDFESASNQMKASLGATTSDLKNYEEVMKNIYNNNYGESYEDIANGIALVHKNIGELDDATLQNVTESAITLRDVFGYELNETTRASKALMDTFGISAEQSMNLLAQGLNSNLNYSDEFIDNINEYSVQFGKLGLTAEDMFDIFQSGSDAGAWNLDKIGDAVKEFSIRAIDGSDATAEGFKALGMDADKMAKKFAGGGEEAKKAFYQVIQGLGEMDDPVKQSIAGVNLFGTMWEDLGPKVVTQLGKVKGMYDSTNDSMQTLKDVKYDDLGSMIEGLKRNFGDLALDLGNTLMPSIISITGSLQTLISQFQNMSPTMQKVVLGVLAFGIAIGPVLSLVSKFKTLITGITSAFKFLFVGTETSGGAIKRFGKSVGGAIKTCAKFIGNLGKMAISYIKLGLQAGLATAKIIAQKVAMVASTVATKAMAIAQGLLNAVMAMNPITLIVLAIIALIGVLVLLWNKCEWFRNGVMAVITTIWSTIKNAVNIIKNIVMVVLSVISKYIKTYVNIYLAIFRTIFTVIKLVLTKVKSIFSTIFKVIATIVKTYINVVLSVFRKIWSVASNIVTKVKNAFVRLGSGIKSVFSSIKNFISNLFGKIAGVVKSPINAVIRGLNKIKLPDWVPGLGGKGINIPLLATGTNYVAGEGLAYLHKGEAVVPKKYNPAVGGFGNSQPIYVNVIADMDVNKFGKAFVRDIKTFSGGAKNDYNYGGM